MKAIAEAFLANPLATVFGVMGLACQLIWPLFRTRKAIVAVQFGVGADYSVHYALLDAWSGAGVAGLGAAQSALAFFCGNRPWFRWVGLVFLPVVASISYVTWSGPPTVCAFAAVTLIMLGRLQRDTLSLRVLQLAAAPFGMSYDIMVGAAPALMGSVVSATIAIVMLVREIRSLEHSAVACATCA